VAKSVLEWTLVAFDRASPIFNGTARSADQMGRAIKGAAFAVGSALGAAATAAAVFSVQSIQAYAAAEQAQNRLNFAFEKFPALVGGNADAFRAMNTELQKTTRFEDDAIAAAQMTLAQYDLTTDQLAKLTPLMLDYAAVTGKDVGSAAEDLGKALLGQGRALKAVGIDFQDAGNPVDNFAQLIAGLSEKVGGFAEKDANTVSGKLDQIKNQFGDVQEKVGQAFVPALDAAAGVIQDTLIPQLDGIVDRVGPKLEAAFEKLGPALADGITKASPYVEKAVEGLAELIPSAIESFGSEFDSSGFFGGLDQVQEDLQGFFDFLTTPIEFGSGEYWEQAGEGFQTWWNRLWDITYRTTQEKSDEIKSYWGSTVAQMKSDTQALQESGTLLGAAFAQGFADGIETNAEKAALAAERMALRTADKVRNAMQIQSPSRVMHALGAFTAQGFAQGVDAEAWRASDSIGRMLNLGSPSGARASAVGVGALGAGGGVTVQVHVDGNVLGTDASIGRAVQTGLVNAIRQGQVNPVELTRALGV